MFKIDLKSALIKSASIYIFANILNASVPFLLLPVLTRYLSPLDYGILATFQVLVGLFSPIVGLNMNGAVTRQYYERDKINFSEYLTNSLLLVISSAIISSLLVYIFSKQISGVSEFPANWLWSIVVVNFFQIIISITLSLWQVKSKPILYGVFQNLQTVFNFGLSILLIIVFGMNWQGRIYAQVVVTFIFGIAGFYVFYRNNLLKLKFNKEYIRHALKFGLPLIPYTFTGWIMLSTDRIFINKMIGLSATGLYSVAYQITLLIGLIQVSFNNAWIPWLYEKLKENNFKVKSKIVKFSYTYIVLNFVFAFILSTFSPWFLKFFLGPKFQGIGIFIFWLALGQAANGIHYITVNYIFYHNKNEYLTVEAVIVALIHIPLTYILIHFNQAVGAAQAMFLSSLLSALITFYFAAKVQKMPWLLNFRYGIHKLTN